MDTMDRFGKGKWRLKGRGRRLACTPKEWKKFSYYIQHQRGCRVCGRKETRFEVGIAAVGRIERVLFISQLC